MKKRIISIITTLALCLSLCPTWAFAEEVEAVPDEVELVEEWDTEVEYVEEWDTLPAALDEAPDEDNDPAPVEGKVSAAYEEASWNESTREVIYSTKNAASCTSVGDSDAEVIWTTGWYVVNNTVNISQPITVNGAVNLILADGCTLNANSGIVVTTGNSLTIYAQEGGTGTLNATGVANDFISASAGIGGTPDTPNSGAVTIHGGTINATGGGTSGGLGGAGIGGGSKANNGGDSGAITIFGGTITANSGAGNTTGAGIGGGACSEDNCTGGAGRDITIYGGSVKAEGSKGGAGIGGGASGRLGIGGAGSNIKICGGNVTATGGGSGAGIGGGSSGGSGKSGAGTSVTISGGKVTAVGGQYAAGIGGGGGCIFNGGFDTTIITGGTGTNITINGGIVDAKGGKGNSSDEYKGDPIGNGGNASGDAGVTRTSGIIFEGGVGKVYGTVTLDQDYSLPADYSLTISTGASLSGSGKLSGGNKYLIEGLTEDMISVPEGWSYTGEDLTEKIKGAVSLSRDAEICGQIFHADTTGWELSVTKVSDLKYTVAYTHTDKGTVSKDVIIDPASLTEDMVTLSATEFTYSGTEQKPFISVDGLTEDTDYTVTFSETSENAGNYEVTIEGKEKYKGTIKKTYAIKQAAPAIAWSSTSQELTYTGDPAAITEPEVTLVNGETFSGTINYSYTKDGTAYKTLPTDAGTYTITASIAENGNYTAATTETPLTLDIHKADVTLTAPSAQTLAYTGAAQALVTAGSANFGDVAYSLTETGPYSTEIPTGTGVGSYTVWYKVEDGTNYNGTAPASVDVTIGKAAALTPQAGTLNIQNGYERTYTFDLDHLRPALGSGQSFGDVAYTLKAVDMTQAGYYDSNTPASISGSTLTLPVKPVTATDEGQIGTITVTVSCTNFEDADTAISIYRINKEPVAIGGVTAQNAAYNGESHNGYTGTPAAGAYTGEYTFTYAKADGTPLDGKPINAGSYIVTVTLADDSEYTAAPLTLEFSITQAEATVTANSQTITKGSAVPAYTYTVTPTGADLGITPVLACAYTAESDTGEYAITVSGAEVSADGNYIISYVAGTLTVRAPSPPSTPVTPPRPTVIPVSGVHLNQSTQTLPVGEGFRLTATVEPSSATQSKAVEWSSSNPTIAEVDSSGNVIGRNPGTAVITVRTISGGYTAVCTVTVEAPEPPQPETYIITYNANGGTGLMEDGTATENEPFTLPECGFTAPEGKEFAGWTIGGTTGVIIEAGGSYVFTSDTTVYAIWKEIPAKTYTITYNANGGSGTMAAGTATEKEPYTLPECGFTAPEGKEFAGWTIGGTTGVIVEAGGSYTFTRNMTVYAVWKEIPAKTYTITYNANSGTGTMAADTATEKQSFTLPECGFTAPEGMEFAGWAIGGTSGEVVEAGGSYVFTQDMTVYAVWKEIPAKTYTITYNAGGGTGTMAAGTATENEAFILPECGFTAPEGKEFAGWSIGSTSGEAVAAGGSYTFSSDTIIYAVWKDKPADPIDPGKTETKLEITEGISEVPPALKELEHLNTPEKVEQTMLTQLGVAKESSAVYDVELLVSMDDGATWSTATKENFPADGLTVTLPYPEGTDSSYRFKVVHMFTTAGFGKTPGDMEEPAITNTEKGIQFTVTGLSPIAVSWEKTSVTPPAPVTPIRPSIPTRPSSSSSSSSSKPSTPSTPTAPSVPVTPAPEPVSGFCDGGPDCPSRAYTDLNTGSWYHEAVDYAIKGGLLTGYGDSTFNPNGSLSRAMLAQILYNMEGRPSVNVGSSFLDVAPDSWYADAVAWAAAKGIVTGYGDGRFGPNDSITREQLAVMLWRYRKEPAATGKELHFSDAGRASSWALEALRWAAENGVLNGKENGTLDPTGTASRAETAQMLHNLSDK